MKEYLENRIRELGCAADVETAIKALRSRVSNSQMDTFHYGLAQGLYEALLRVSPTLQE